MHPFLLSQTAQALRGAWSDQPGYRYGMLRLPHGEQILLWRRIRGHWVLRDRQVAAVLGIPTRELNRRWRRNPRLFPDDFAFRITQQEFERYFRVLEGGCARRGGGEPLVYSAAGLLQHLTLLDAAARLDWLRWAARVLAALQAATPDALPIIPPRS